MALDAITHEIDRLPATGDPRPIAAEIEALRHDPCVALAFEDKDVSLEWKTGLSLRRWWLDGGRAWLETYLMLDEESSRYVATPPSVRNVLSSDGATGSLLSPILCPLRAVDDGSCGAESAAWLSRADAELTPLWKSSPSPDEYCLGLLARLGEHPEQAPKDMLEGSPYVRFRTCLGGHADRVDALPLGAFRAPSDGWLFVNRSVFISQQNCNQTILGYDLATGAAYLRRCLPDLGPPRTEVGRVSRSALRELALILVLANKVEPRLRLHAQTFPVPREMAIGRVPGERAGVPGEVMIESSDRPGLIWTWMRRKTPGGPLEGVMSDWASTAYSAPAYADRLLRDVLASFKVGCAPAPLPSPIPWKKPGPPVSGDRDHASELFGELLARDAEKELAKATAPPSPTCPIIP